MDVDEDAAGFDGSEVRAVEGKTEVKRAMEEVLLTGHD